MMTAFIFGKSPGFNRQMEQAYGPGWGGDSGPEVSDRWGLVCLARKMGGLWAQCPSWGVAAARKPLKF